MCKIKKEELDELLKSKPNKKIEKNFIKFLCNTSTEAKNLVMQTDDYFNGLDLCQISEVPEITEYTLDNPPIDIDRNHIIILKVCSNTNSESLFKKIDNIPVKNFSKYQGLGIIQVSDKDDEKIIVIK